MTATQSLLVLVLSAALLSAGCISTMKDDSDDIDTASAGNGTAKILLNTDNLPEDLHHLELSLDQVFVHDAATPAPDGYHEVSTIRAARVLVLAGEAQGAVEVASGEVPAGDYDQVLLRLTGTKGQLGGNVSDDGHGHVHDEAEGAFASEGEVIDLPINLTFEVVEDKSTEVELVLDAGASVEGGSFSATLSRAVVSQDGNVVREDTEVTIAQQGQGPTTTTSTAKPVARIAVFGPDGAQVYKAPFLAEDGDFANTLSGAFPVGSEVRFSGTDSEAVEPGATLSSYAWDFDDGNTGTGPTVSHAYDGPGVFEVKLTIKDSEGGTDPQLVRVVVSGWSTMLYNSSFEEAEEDWTVSNGDLMVASDTGLSGWARDGVGRTGATAWHVGLHLHAACVTDVCGPEAYLPLADSLLVSPEFTIPADWSSAGYSFYVAGGSEAGFDILTVSYTIGGGDPVSVGEFSGNQGWTEVGAPDALSDAVGKTVQFQFHFTSDEAVQAGGGWSLDDFEIGGVDVPLHKAHLLEEGAHDGHDHEH